MKKRSKMNNLLKKYLVFFVLIFLSFLGCSHKPTTGFSIYGKLKFVKNSRIILYKIVNINTNEKVYIDSISVNRKGNFKSVYFISPGIYELKIDTTNIKVAINSGQQLKFFGKNMNQLKIKGSPDTKSLLNYEKFRKASLKKWVVKIRNQIKNNKNLKLDSIVKLRQLETLNYHKHLKELTNYVFENMDNSIAFYATVNRWIADTDLNRLEEMINNVEKITPKSEYLPQLKKRLQILKNRKQGNEFIAIQLPNLENNLLSINPKKHQLTLVDFWASWCPPCRTESMLLNKIYQKHHSKGFEIYSISLDIKTEKWKNAIKKDRRKWINVSDLNGFKSKPIKQLGITSLPFNFLIDNQNKIVAINLFGPALEQKIDAYFNR